MALVLTLRVYHVVPDAVLGEIIRFRQPLRRLYRRGSADSPVRSIGEDGGTRAIPAAHPTRAAPGPLPQRLMTPTGRMSAGESICAASPFAPQ